MKSKISPEWVLLEICDLIHQGVDIYDWELVKDFLSGQKRFTMLDWIQDHRQLFYYSILSKQYENIEFYYGSKR